MPNLLARHELERRLLNWTGSSYVPRYPFFEGPATSSLSASGSSSIGSLVSRNSQDLNRWFNDIELAAHDCDVPLEQHPDVAIYFLRGDLREVMCERRDVYLRQTKKVFWTWEDFKEDLRRIVVVTSPQMSSLASDAIEQLRRAHPYIAVSVKLGLIIGGTAVLLPALGVMTWSRLQTKQHAAVQSPQ
ncbi:hypothetical protein CVT25_000902 [Psilocybe cyanescens]|uniref:Uncharacterized protein n=1 Tax=Psilocybe cyanescens TaxID=93625 RepID=A0A409WZ84_PSICY|nr:hypothetical protein CVT25_000902 [Psilocybe cyanescens]